MTTTFRTPATRIILSEGQGPLREFQLIRTCQFKHPKYGKVTITKEMLDQMVLNHKNGARGIEIFLDKEHEMSESYGKFAELKVKQNVENGEYQLWAAIELTELGLDAVDKKIFNYLSADFDSQYENPENGKKFGCVLLGAALTNRPFIKNMAPVTQLSELSQGDEKMFEQKYNDLKKKINDASGMDVENEEQMNKINEMIAIGKKGGSVEVELTNTKQTLSEKSSEVIKLNEKVTSLQAENQALKSEKEAAELEKNFNMLFSEGKISKGQKEQFLKLAKIDLDGTVSLFKNGPTLKLSEQGHDGEKPGDEKSAVEEVETKVEAKLKEDKTLSYVAATKIVLSENEELRTRYNKETSVQN